MHVLPSRGHRDGASGDEAGSALVWSVFFVALTTGMLIAHSFEMAANRRTMDTRFARVDRARAVAASGLTEAASYLRRQPTQPVVTFAPQLDPTADPPVDDTMDPAVGLVREFQIHGDLWARYEVRHEDVVDVSASHGEPAGTVWDVGARGYLFQRAAPQRPFDAAPNRVVSMQQVRSELRGLPIQLPAGAAVIANDVKKISMLGNGAIDGAGFPAVAYKKPALALPLPILDVMITGIPPSVEIFGLQLGTEDLFRLRSDQLRSLADLVVDSGRQLPQTIVRDKAIYVPGKLNLDQKTPPLRGRMLLVVDGSLDAKDGNDADFSGVVYVRDNVTLRGPFRFAGTMIVGGTLAIGGGADGVSIRYDPDEVNALGMALSRYRVSRDVRPSGTDGAFADPSDLDLDAALR